MPVERTVKSWKMPESSSSCNQLVWTAPVAPTPSSEPTAFITEVDFDDGPPPLVDAPPYPPPGEFILFPPAEEKAPARKTPHSKKKPENHIPRPPNAFILFRSSFIKSQHVSTSVETNHSTLSKIIGMTWKNLSEAERQVWHAKAKVAQEEHRRKFPKYAFRPQQTKSKGGTTEKRKVREVEPKDLTRCKKIAELLVQGKKGDDLKAEIEEFDKHHVPQIITRFEAPITERTFQRSSSAPIPDTEVTAANKSFLPKSPAAKPRKVRSTSAQPTRCATPVQQVEPQQTQPAPMKQEPSFDFSTFSFETAASPASPFPCDPIAEQAAPTTFTGEPSFNPNLTINTNFMEQWSQCSSPVTPEASTDFLATPIGSPSFAPTVDPFDSMKSFNEFNPMFPTYQQQPLGSLCGDGFLGVGGDDFSHMINPVNPLGVGMDFSFMNEVPQYVF
ncbi:specific transcriptional repressor [Coprinopsis cinerea AmutBmut pab1-1]|nr:specific transcriptional repressor [Coprinopsis cinerea AmutBmut pab1-1]